MSWVTTRNAGAHRGAEFQHQVLNALGSVRIEVAGGLIEHHQPRIVDQCTGDHTLALATRQLCRLVLQAMAQTHPESAARSHVRAPRDRGFTDQQWHADVFQRGEFGQQMVKLVNEAQRAVSQQATGLFAQRRQLFARQPDAARRRGVEAAEQIEQGTFCPNPRSRQSPRARPGAAPAAGRTTPRPTPGLPRRTCPGRGNSTLLVLSCPTHS